MGHGPPFVFPITFTTENHLKKIRWICNTPLLIVFKHSRQGRKRGVFSSLKQFYLTLHTIADCCTVPKKHRYKSIKINLNQCALKTFAVEYIPPHLLNGDSLSVQTVILSGTLPFQHLCILCFPIKENTNGNQLYSVGLLFHF